jgi:ABC-type phosphate/phosphonate transport system permease subunit
MKGRIRLSRLCLGINIDRIQVFIFLCYRKTYNITAMPMRDRRPTFQASVTPWTFVAAPVWVELANIVVVVPVAPLVAVPVALLLALPVAEAVVPVTVLPEPASFALYGAAVTVKV